MKRKTGLGRNGDGWFFYIDDWAYHAAFVDWAWDKLCTVTGGWAGGHGCPGWMWKIPVGRPRWDVTSFGSDDPLLENSLAGLLYNIENRVIFWADSDDHVRRIATIKIDEETARKIDPEAVAEWEDDEEEDAA